MENGGDEKVSSDAFLARAQYCRLAYDVIQDYNLAFDIGSNLGGFSFAHHDRFKKIVCVEAMPETFNECEKNIGYLSNVTIINRAVSKESGEEISIYKHSNGDSGSSSCVNNKITSLDLKEPVSVKTISYEKLVEEHGVPDYMKVDIEGSEYDFLMNKDLSGVKFLSLELHVGFLSGSQRKSLMKHLMNFFTIYKHRKAAAGKRHDEFSLINWKLHTDDY